MTKRKPVSSAPLDRTAYRGYLICTNPLNGSAWIEQDGYCIAHLTVGADTLIGVIEAGRKVIDELLEEMK